MKMIAKILIGILGILFIFAIIWFGMPNVQNAFKDVKMISVTVKLENKCSLDDDSFIVAVPVSYTHLTLPTIYSV